MKTLCIYHGNCADGFTAAWAVHSRFGNDWDYHPGVYQSPPPDVTGRDVVLVDFSYKRPMLEEMRRTAASVCVLDHHKTAAEDLAPGGSFISMSQWQDKPGDLYEALLFDRAIDQNEGARSIQVLFDMSRSGAGIAWDFFHRQERLPPPYVSRPTIVKYVEDRDLWKFELPFSREINAFIFAHDYSFDVWQSLMLQLETRFDTCVDMGAAIEKKHHKDVAELVGALKRRLTIGGHEVWAANLPYTLTSDAGHLMATGESFAACYWDTPEGRVFSLRSTDEGLDVSEIAKAYGGGGHRNAAGFRLPHGVAP
jgi:oligoribonuclease NrnB/cAMP/cGMP phosphodiesterase (DHH superfamily)